MFFLYPIHKWLKNTFVLSIKKCWCMKKPSMDWDSFSPVSEKMGYMRKKSTLLRIFFKVWSFYKIKIIVLVVGGNNLRKPALPSRLWEWKDRSVPPWKHVYSYPWFSYLLCRNEQMELEEALDMWTQVCVMTF